MKPSKYFPAQRASVLLLTVMSMQVSAEDEDIHPSGLFTKPQPGLAAPVSRTTADAENWKDWLHFSVNSNVRYDDNIYRSSQNEESDVIFSVSPTLRLATAESGTAENILTVTYVPSFRYYVDNTQRNTVDHRFGLRFGKTMPKTQISFTTDYSKSTGSDRFVAGTVDRESLRAGVSVSHSLTGKTRVTASAHYNLDNFNNSTLFDDSSYGARVALLYQVTGKISVGPYLSYSQSNLSTGSNDQESLGYGVTFNYGVSGKTNITGSVGYSNRSFSGTGAASDQNSATWEIGMSHALSGKTNIRASIFRRENASYATANSGYLATGLSLSATYRQSARFSHYSTFTFENDDYFSSGAAAVAREDDYLRITVGSRYHHQDGLTLGANVSYSDKDSKVGSQGFENLTFGLNAQYNFW